MSLLKTIFWDPRMQKKKGGDNFLVVAKKPFKKGALLMLEHSFSGSPKVCADYILNDTDLMKILYPRVKLPDETEPDFSSRKLLSNSFRSGITEGGFMFGKDVSLFNHHCIPNAATWQVPMDETYPMTFTLVYAIRDIKKTEQVYIHYGNGIGHTQVKAHDFRCPCGQGQETPLDLPLVESIHKSKRDNIIRTYIKPYMNTSEGIALQFLQHMARLGLYIQQDAVRFTSTVGGENPEQLLQKEMNSFVRHLKVYEIPDKIVREFIDKVAKVNETNATKNQNIA